MLYITPNLRSAAITCRIQPTILKTSTYHTTAPPLRAQDQPSTAPRRRASPMKRQVLFKKLDLTTPTIRSASSVSTPAPATETPAHTASSHQSQDLLDWNTFFKLRKTRRWYQVCSSIGASLNGFILGAEVLTRADMDKLVSQIPLDPFITLGMITFACGGVGWLAGPVLGTAMFNWRNRKFRKQMDKKEKEFYKRVKKYRVDPSTSSMANPVPDYYGEKIASVAGYRQWLKDQRAFNRKRQTYVR